MASADLMNEDNEAGWLTITMDEFVEHGPEEAARIVKERAGDLPTIISFDVDVLEPGECPGIGFPEPGVCNNKCMIGLKFMSLQVECDAENCLHF